MVCSKSPT